jgi:hypothetical protein
MVCREQSSNHSAGCLVHPTKLKTNSFAKVQFCFQRNCLKVMLLLHRVRKNLQQKPRNFLFWEELSAGQDLLP